MFFPPEMRLFYIIYPSVTTKMSDIEVVDDLEPEIRANFAQRIYSSIQYLTSSLYFDTFVLTLIFGLCLYLADIISDVYTGINYFIKGDTLEGSLTIALIFLPGFVRGIYELFRRPVVYESSNKSSFKLRDDIRKCTTIFACFLHCVEY